MDFQEECETTDQMLGAAMHAVEKELEGVGLGGKDLSPLEAGKVIHRCEMRTGETFDKERLYKGDLAKFLQPEDFLPMTEETTEQKSARVLGALEIGKKTIPELVAKYQSLTAEQKGLHSAGSFAVDQATMSKTISGTQEKFLLETTRALETKMDKKDVAQEGGVLPETEARSLMVEALRFLEMGSRLITRGENLKKEGLVLMQHALVGMDVGQFQPLLRKWFGGGAPPVQQPKFEEVSDDSAPTEGDEEQQEASTDEEETEEAVQPQQSRRKRKRSVDTSPGQQSKRERSSQPKPLTFTVVTDEEVPAKMGIPADMLPIKRKLPDGKKRYTCMIEGCDTSISGCDSAHTHVRKSHQLQKILCHICGYTSWSSRQIKDHHRDTHKKEGKSIMAPQGYVIPPVDPPALEEEEHPLEVKEEADEAQREEVEEAIRVAAKE